jgi:plasmid stabilization system protein ParE
VKALPVIVRPQAQAQLREAAEWWADHHSLEQAERWFDEIAVAIERIGDDPRRYPKINEPGGWGIEVREMLFGVGRRPTHRVLFTIRPEMVYVLSVRHVSQAPLGPDDLP